MKCNHCGSQWNVNPGLSVSITNCPFCGKSLLPEKKNLNTIEDVLVEINRRFGMQVLTDERKLIAYFSDLAPQLSRQRRILDYFVECGGPGKIAAVMNAGEEEQSGCIMRIVSQMKEEMYVEETASRMICETFLFVVSGRRVAGIADTPSGKTESTPVVKPVIPAGMTTEEEYQKGEAFYNGKGASRDYQQAFQWYQKAALRGHPMAQCRMGLMYREGQGVAQDKKEAFSWFLKAAHADQNCPRGKFYVGRCYEYGDGVAVDPKEAVRWYTMAARENDDYAQINLGICYEYGTGVEKNYETAAHWYGLAARQGEPLAKCNLGCLYQEGKGVPKDPDKAFALFRESAAQEEPAGLLELGLCYLKGTGTGKDTQQAFSNIKRSAELGYDDAQFRLAVGYEEGYWGSKDPAQAFFWYKKAAEQGHSRGETSVGQCYADGKGVKQDYAEAVRWYRKAADRGYGYAMTLLGACYENGNGVARDEEQALMWYRKAAKAGDPLAQVSLKLMELEKEEQEFDAQMAEISGTQKQNTASRPNQVVDDGDDFRKKLRKDVLRTQMTQNYVDVTHLKHSVEDYIPSGFREFHKKIDKAIRAYAEPARRETPLLMMDDTIFGSAKEGFVLTDKTLYWNGRIVVKKGQCPLENITGVYIKTVGDGELYGIMLEVDEPVSGEKRFDISTTTDKKQASNMEAFWKELLLIVG